MIKSLGQLVSDDSFRRFISGGADEKEKKIWTNWINSNPAHQRMYEEALFFLKEFQIESRVYTDDAKDWAELEQRISQDDAALIHKLPIYSGDQSAFKFLLRYAAIFLVVSLVGLGLWLIYFSNCTGNIGSKKVAEVTIQTGYREFKTFKVSDGSKIILAPNSKLTYKKDWLSKPIKELKLSGEAYFNIKEKKKPTGKVRYKIVTSFGVIRDIGTRFNISTFDHKTRVVLESGIVNVSKQDQLTDSSTRILRPGQMALLSKKIPSIKVSEVNTRIYTSWKTKTLYFEDTPLPFFLSYLKNFYGLHVVVRDSTLLSKRLSDGIDRGSVKDMLNVISHVLNIKMYQRGNTVYVEDGIPDFNSK